MIRTPDGVSSHQLDEILQRMRAEADGYVSQPKLFLFQFLELELDANDGKQMILCDGTDWSCTCAFFLEWRTCSHIMATATLLTELLLQVQIGGSDED